MRLGSISSGLWKFHHQPAGTPRVSPSHAFNITRACLNRISPVTHHRPAHSSVEILIWRYRSQGKGAAKQGPRVNIVKSVSNRLNAYSNSRPIIPCYHSEDGKDGIHILASSTLCFALNKLLAYGIWLFSYMQYTFHALLGMANPIQCINTSSRAYETFNPVLKVGQRVWARPTMGITPSGGLVPTDHHTIQPLPWQIPINWC